MQDEGILRGEIYYVAIPYATGHEMEKDRPAIVVSCEELNRTSPCVAVVMCSASPKKELPEHITPLGAVAIGRPDKVKEPNDRYEAEKVFFGKYEERG